jgi:hypothetical protein
MRKNKIILVALITGSLIGIVFFSLLAFVSFQLKDVKTPLITYLKSQIDGDLQIGDAEVVFFPAGINLKDVKLFAPGETVPSATISKAKLRFNLLPLIKD